MCPIVDRLTPPLIKRRLPYVYPEVTHVCKYRRLSASFCAFAESLRRRLLVVHLVNIVSIGIRIRTECLAHSTMSGHDTHLASGPQFSYNTVATRRSLTS